MRTLLFAALALVFMLTFGGPALADHPGHGNHGNQGGCSFDFDCDPDGWAAVIINTDGGVTATGITNGYISGSTSVSGEGSVLQPGYCGVESYNNYTDFDHDYLGVAMTSEANGSVLAMSAGHITGGHNVASGNGTTTATMYGTVTLPGLAGYGNTTSVVNISGSANTN